MAEKDILAQIQSLLEKEKELEKLKEKTKTLEEKISELEKSLRDAKLQETGMVAEHQDEIASLYAEHNRKVEEQKNEYIRLWKEAQAEYERILTERQAAYLELVEELKALTSPPRQIGYFVRKNEDGTIEVRDNHRAPWAVAVSPKIAVDELKEGQLLELSKDSLAAIKALPYKPSGEIGVVRFILDEERAIIAIDDRPAIAYLPRLAEGEKPFEDGEKVIFDKDSRFIIERLPKTGEEQEVEIEDVVRKTFADIGGLKEDVAKIRQIVEAPLLHPEVFEALGQEPPKGILISGPPGCGKTLIGQVLANEIEAKFINFSGAEITRSYYGESEALLRSIFAHAQKNAPAIIFIDEIDALMPKREELHEGQQVEKRIADQFLHLLDGIKARGKVIVIGATNVPDLLDPALRRPGRLETEIVIGVPNKQGRREIFEIHTRKMPLAIDVSLDELAEITHGYVGADIEGVCKEAILNLTKDLDYEQITVEQVKELKVARENFLNALKVVGPSSLREFVIQKPTETWDDIGGLDEIKRQLREIIEWPLKYAELLKYAKFRQLKGILLYGPPGCGKTLLCRALANECGINFIAIKGPELRNKYVGESEAAVRKLFKKARQSAPCLVLLDEFDAIAPVRGIGAGDSRVSENIVSQLLAEIDGIEQLQGVYIVATTNRPELLDQAVIRAGRFDLKFEVPYPDEEGMVKIFEVHTKGKPLAEDVNLRKLAESLKPFSILFPTENGRRFRGDVYFSGSDIERICQAATLFAIREFIESGNENFEEFKIEKTHFDKAVNTCEKMAMKNQLSKKPASSKKKQGSRPRKKAGEVPSVDEEARKPEDLM